MFFQFRKAENATPILSNSQTAFYSPDVPAETRVVPTVRRNVGEQSFDQGSFLVSK
jgi:hypothetical protein